MASLLTSSKYSNAKPNKGYSSSTGRLANSLASSANSSFLGDSLLGNFVSSKLSKTNSGIANKTLERNKKTSDKVKDSLPEEMHHLVDSQFKKLSSDLSKDALDKFNHEMAILSKVSNTISNYDPSNASTPEEASYLKSLQDQAILEHKSMISYIKETTDFSKSIGTSAPLKQITGGSASATIYEPTMNQIKSTESKLVSTIKDSFKDQTKSQDDSQKQRDRLYDSSEYKRDAKQDTMASALEELNENSIKSSDITNQNLAKMLKIDDKQLKATENNGNSGGLLDNVGGGKRSMFSKAMSFLNPKNMTTGMKIGGSAFGAVLNGFSKYEDVKDDKSLTTGQKSVQVGASAVGAGAGALLGSALGPLGTIAGGYLGGKVGDWAGGAVSDFMGSPKGKAISKSISSMTDSVSDASKSAMDGVKKVGKDISKFSSDSFSKVSKFGKDVFSGFTDNIGTLMGGVMGIGSKISGIAQNIGAGAGKAWSGAKNIAGEAWEGAKDLANKGVGAISAHFESGGAGDAGKVSSGNGDLGGVSYGTHQLTAKTMPSYLAHSKYGKEFQGLQAGTQEFSNKWKEVAGRDKDGFAKDQEQFIGATHYTPQANKLKSETGLDVNSKSKALQSAVYSASVQFGGNTDLVKKAMAEAKLDPKTASDKDIINAIYTYKKNHNSTLFGGSSSKVQASTLKRASDEQQTVLASLDQEQKDGAKGGVITKPSDAKAVATKDVSISPKEKASLLKTRDSLTNTLTKLQANPKSNPNTIKAVADKISEIDGQLGIKDSPEVAMLKKQGVKDPAVLATFSNGKVNKISPLKSNTPTAPIAKNNTNSSEKHTTVVNNQTASKGSGSSIKSPRYSSDNMMLNLMAMS